MKTILEDTLCNDTKPEITNNLIITSENFLISAWKKKAQGFHWSELR